MLFYDFLLWWANIWIIAYASALQSAVSMANIRTQNP